MSTATLKELDRAAEAKRTWLRERDRLTDAVSTARGRLKNLEATLAQPDYAAAALQNILALADAIPEGVQTRGDGLGIMGGHDVQHMLKKVAADALIAVANRRKRMEDDLEPARQKLTEIENALARHLKQTIHAGDVRLTMPEMTARGTASTR
jgi:hypothetical protein